MGHWLTTSDGVERSAAEWSGVTSGSLFHECESFFNGPTEPHIIVNVMKESESLPILVGIFGKMGSLSSGRKKSICKM